MVGDDGEFDLMFENFEKANESLIVKMQEQEFVSRYLPALANVGSKVDIQPWMTAAGSALLPVDIYDGAKFLYRVPPLNHTIQTKGTRTTINESIDEIAKTATLKTRQHAQLGRAYLVNELTPRVGAVLERSLIDDLKAWNAILARYNYPTILPDIAPPEEGGVKPTSFVDDDETYEDI